MTTISPTQHAILKAAAKLPKEDVRQHMGELKSPAIREKVLQSMIKNGLVKEAEEGDGVIYVITQAAITNFGGRRGRVQKPSGEPKKVKTETTGAPKATKQQMIIDMLSRKDGATFEQMMEATGWQRHSLHGAIAGSLRKKLGLVIESEKNTTGERVYRIA